MEHDRRSLSAVVVHPYEDCLHGASDRARQGTGA